MRGCDVCGCFDGVLLCVLLYTLHTSHSYIYLIDSCCSNIHNINVMANNVVAQVIISSTRLEAIMRKGCNIINFSCNATLLADLIISVVFCHVT